MTTQKHHATSRNQQIDMMTTTLSGPCSQMPGDDQNRVITVTLTTLPRAATGSRDNAPDTAQLLATIIMRLTPALPCQQHGRAQL